MDGEGHSVVLAACLHIASGVFITGSFCKCRHAFFFATNARQFAQDLRSGLIPLPGEWVLRQARTRLDVMTILWERQLFMSWVSLRYILADSATVNGRNYLCVREDSIRYPANQSLGAEFRKSYDINIGFHSRLLPLSSSGLGEATATKKTANFAHIYRMESETLADFDARRCSLRGVTTDQGAERGMADETANILPHCKGKYAAVDPMSFMWPRAFYIMGHLHLLYNALEEACKGMGEKSKPW